MGYAKEKITKVVLPSDSNYWVKVKTLRYGDLKKYVQYGGDEGFLTTGEKLRLAIVEWNLDDDNGTILPVTEENIDLLQDFDVEAVADAAIPKQSDQAKKNSSSK